ncbi:MAG: glycosyltransferase [Devosia sp.]
MAIESAAGIAVHHYRGGPFQKRGTGYPPLQLFADGVRQGRSARTLCERLASGGYRPDLIIGHPGWGDMAFLRDVWSDVPVVAYLEYYYSSGAPDAMYDPEFASGTPDREFVRLRNLHQVMAHEIADICISATEWQRSLFPRSIRDDIRVMHEGVDTERVKPNPEATLALPNGRVITRKDKVLTYCARNLEPYRGFHRFMRALPELQRADPDFYCVIVGGDEVSYGKRPTTARTWREALLSEVGSDLDSSRICWIPKLDYDNYLALLAVSTVHVYLTYPFVLSWSLLEAMSAGCAIVAADTGPVREVIVEGKSGVLVDFFDPQSLVDAVSGLMISRATREHLGRQARQVMIDRYDFSRRTLPAYGRLVAELAGSKASRQ